MNLHIMYDEKVISRAIQYFEEALPGQNKYIIFSKKRKEDRIVKTELPTVLFTTYGSKGFWEFVGDTQAYNNIILHYLGFQSVKFAEEVSNTDNFVWIVWGGDLYNMILEPYGYRLYADPKVCGNWLHRFFSRDNMLWRKYLAKKRVKLMKRIPNMAILNCDYKLLREYFPEIKPLVRKFFYYPVNDMVNYSLLNRRIISNNIFVGNSSQPTNNHHSVFEAISKYDIGERKVITPLSYGSKQGKDDALKWGKILLKDNFYPITDYLPLEKYNELMLSANIFIYGQYRQEAFGNIVVALYIGGIVVLDPRNPLMYDLKDNGFIVFSIEDLGKLISYKMPEESIQKNRSLINTYYSRENLLRVIKESFG